MLTDSHCHLDFTCFDDQRDALFERCHRAGVNHFVIPGTTADSWAKVRQIGQQYDYCKIALGLHPYFLHQFEPAHLAQLEQTLALGEVVAVGEIGLDKWPGMPDYALQQSVFRSQLSIAQQFELPVIVHARKSEDDLLKLLRQQKFRAGGIVHAFNGSLVQAERFAELGFVLGIGGTVTYPRAQKARRVLQALSDQAFVLETDAPDMPVCGYQGQINSPERLMLIAQEVATLRQQTIESVAQQTNDNLLRVLPNWHEV